MESLVKTRTALVAVLNITPDSFSDGGLYLNCERAVLHAKALVQDGADIIDVGGDSTRPGSNCIGAKKEWERVIAPVTEISKFAAVSIDTHHSEVAENALLNGASIVNDISGGSDPRMFEVVAQAQCKFIMTYTRCVSPHNFSRPASPGDLINHIKSYFSDKINEALTKGVRKEQIVLDPGMGAFISESPEDSWKLLARLNEFSDFDMPFMLGISRKGFLKHNSEKRIQERDLTSAYLSALILKIFKSIDIKYFRVHEIRKHKNLLRQ